ncbi:DUF7114 family protein [Halobiforma nitratireducens]|uniref:Uncharacterized protein n=1 Tax=Halobiforma nitratireducens JCM 10879 TaxID=1227454 RepID=M0LE86_9EURY|nr:hypothetical protein [Halobiforma nitratireducens]EMA31872.1 hypothetical protein C446_15151 [Halobiforma nitratireducens JCM 10879]
METADNCRRAAFEAVADVEPPRLHDLVESVLDGASMVPGVLALESAAAVTAETNAAANAGAAGRNGDRERKKNGTGTGTGTGTETGTGTANQSPDDTITTTGTETGTLDDVDGVLTHAAGVQLIYEGLRLTRTLAHEEPWSDSAIPNESANGDSVADGRANCHPGTAADPDSSVAGTVETDTQADLEILAADILVARGFYLLARTEAASTAVRTVQAFGRDQTRREELVDDDSVSDRAADLDANLERDVLELAVRTGATAADEPPTAGLLSVADEIADEVGTSFPPAEAWFDDSGAAISERTFDLEDPTTDRATSATDP